MTLWTPVSIAFLISLRAANIGVVSDYLIGFDSVWHTVSVSMELERQDNYQYFNYEVGAGTETLKGKRWDWDIGSRVSEARDISRQNVTVRRRFWFLGVGVAGVADSYDFNRSKGVNDFRIALFSYGYVNYQTNYSGIEILDVYLKIEEKGDSMIKPFITSRFYNVVGGENDWQIQVGFKINFEEDQ